MRFLADESCDFRVVRVLRAAGHDVKAIIEIAPGVSDDSVIAKAIEERRVFITEDRDFGQLVFAAAKPVCVILLRFPSAARASLSSAVADFIAMHGAELDDRFVVMEPGRIRITRLS